LEAVRQYRRCYSNRTSRCRERRKVSGTSWRVLEKYGRSVEPDGEFSWKKVI